MEKLIELLREYIRPKYEFGKYGVYLSKQNKLILEEQHSFMGYGIEEEWYTDVEFGESIIISKKFGFIKWLVENEKINFHGIPNIFTSIYAEKREEVYYEIEHNNYSVLTEQYGVEHTNRLLMLLSIQDEPIEFLVSILK